MSNPILKFVTVALATVSLPLWAGDSFTLPPVPSIAPTQSGARTDGAPRLLVQHIAFRGNTVVATSQLDVLARSYIGRPLTDADLEELRQVLTHFYIDHGYFNSGAILKNDAIVGSTVTFDLIEGRLSGVSIKGLERLHENYVTGRLIKDGSAPLNVDDLRDRFQTLLEDPLFQRMTARLVPDAALGEAILDVDVVRARPYQMRAFGNNYSSPSVGADSYGVSGWIRNLTGYGDQLDASVDGGNGSSGGRYTLGWHVPLNSVGTALSAQVDHGRSSVVEARLQPLDIVSILDAQDVGLSQTVWETMRHKLTLGVNQSERKNTTTLLGLRYSFSLGEPDGVTQVSASRFWQEYNYRDEKQALTFRSTFTWAKNNFVQATGLPVGTPQVADQYAIWLGQVQYARQVLENGAQVSIRETSQQSNKTLASLDRMAIGGVHTVRGFLENTLTCDTGNVVNVEFSYPMVRNPGKGLNMSVIPFYDLGYGKNQNEAGETLSSAGVATHITWQGLTLDIAAASRLTQPASVATGDKSLQGQGVHLQLSYDFF